MINNSDHVIFRIHRLLPFDIGQAGKEEFPGGYAGTITRQLNEK
jgi:hypothetical protein